LPAAGRVAEPKRRDGRVLQPALPEVVARLRGARQLFLVEARRQRVHLKETLALRGPLLPLPAALERQPELARQPLERLDERDILDALHEGEDAPPRAAAPAAPEPALRVHGQRRVAVRVEGTESLEVPPRRPQRHVAANNFLQPRAVAYLFAQ